MMELSEYKKLIEKKYGEGTCIIASEVKKKKRYTIPVSPALDLALGSGISTSSMVVIHGETKCGKTTLALSIANEARKIYGAQIFLANVEGRFSNQTLGCVAGLNPDDVAVIETTKDRIMYAEDFLDAMEIAIMNVDNFVLIVDSVSRLYTKACSESEVSGTRRPTSQKLLADFVSRISGVVAAKNGIIIFIGQTYSNISGYGAAKLPSGGNAINFGASTILRVKKVEDWVGKVDGEDVRFGNQLTFDVIANSNSGSPLNTVKTYIKFGYGVAREKEIANLAIDFGLCSKKGAWYQLESFEDSEPIKFHGEDNFVKYLEENKDISEKIYKHIYSMCIDPKILEYYENTKTKE